MKIKINEDQLRLIVENNDNKKRLLSVSPKLLLNMPDLVIQKVKDKGFDGLNVIGSLNLGFFGIEKVKMILDNLVRVDGNLEVYSNIQTLGKLEFVGGTFTLRSLIIKTLGNLKHVGSFLDLGECGVLESLGDLEYVGSDLYLKHTKVSELGNLKYVGGALVIYFSPLNKMNHKDIRDKVEINGKIYWL